MNYQNIIFEKEGAVASIILDKAPRLNSLSREMIEEIIDALSRLEEARVLLLAANGRAFCCGADLSEGTTMEDWSGFDAGAGLESHLNPLVDAIVSLKIPVVCAVNGAAAGAGASVALACDIVIAARSAYFLQAFVGIGLIPDAGANWTLPRLAGKARALGMMLLGDRIEAEQAERWGLIWKCVEDEQLMTVATDYACRLGAGPTQTYGLIRRAARLGLELGWAETLAMERECQRSASRTKDFQEGVSAFLEKRPARFNGR
jgi:2-(1,2-epoxy-1,2-dihydrophenyl)acetyl-CoA isomerase